jgi:CDP-glycerol glycerophosphotransferase
MIENIRDFDEEQYVSDANAFFEKYGTFDDGHASERVVRRILDVMEE